MLISSIPSDACVYLRNPGLRHLSSLQWPCGPCPRLQVDMHKLKFGERFDDAYPALVAHHAKIAALPTVAAYLAGPNRPSR